MTPQSFNSLSRDHRLQNVLQLSHLLLDQSFQLPLSGSLAVYAYFVFAKLNNNFQLPLSGSLEVLVSRYTYLRRLCLSTPSLGITARQALDALEALIKAFNSLSRDHMKHSWTFTVILEHVTFQLPLSGSLSDGYRKTSEELAKLFLSTPSLGITISYPRPTSEI